MFTVQSVFSLEGMNVHYSGNQRASFLVQMPSDCIDEKQQNNHNNTAHERREQKIRSSHCDNSEQMMVGRMPRAYSLTKGYHQFIVLPSS